jgi:glycosyltransferase involved in cell wall biosynthesis
LHDLVEASRIVFDLTDLVAFYSQFANVTGIQRVTERLTATKYLQGDRNTCFVARARDTNLFFQLDKTLLAELARPETRLATISKLNAIAVYLNDYRLLQRLKKCPWKLLTRKYRHLNRRKKKARSAYSFARFTPFEFKSGDSLVVPGAYWIERNAANRYIKLRAQHGLSLCIFVYDLIPISHPWCTSPQHAERFRGEFDEIIRSCDRLVVGSRHVAGEASQYLKARGVDPKPNLVFSYGWDFPEYSSDRRGEAVTLARYGLKRRDFVLVVGTLELRKNHCLIVRATHNLYPRLKDRIPHILLVGRPGWGAEFIEGEFASTGYLGGRIRVLANVTDSELANLYAACRFTIFPSFVEGWGLPVQESLAFGRPCLASSATSIPEAGLDLATYFDPCDLPAFQDLLARWIEDDAEVVAAEARITQYFATSTLPRWEDSAAAVMNFVRSGDVAPDIRRVGWDGSVTSGG